MTDKTPRVRRDYLWAHKEILAGGKVMRFEARWFIQLVDGRMCTYRIDGASNRVFAGITTLSSADLMALDWVSYE
jgi:hypothetical protein